jgi:hypothetical protein
LTYHETPLQPSHDEACCVPCYPIAINAPFPSWDALRWEGNLYNISFEHFNLLICCLIDRQSVRSLVDDDQYTPPTPPHTTITPNDNDEGIYLLWTQHMLRQKGFRPSSYNLNDDDSDSDSTNSSLTDDDVEDDRPLPTMLSYHVIPYSQKVTPDIIAKEEEVKGWMGVSFCGFCFM